MVKNINERFTKWYIKQGYEFEYDFTGVPIVKYGPFRAPLDTPNSCFRCPWWVIPLLIFFSPSVYYRDAVGQLIHDSFMEGMRMALEENDEKLLFEDDETKGE